MPQDRRSQGRQGPGSGPAFFFLRTTCLYTVGFLPNPPKHAKMPPQIREGELLPIEVGDMVQVINDKSIWKGEIGKVTQIVQRDNRLPVFKIETYNRTIICVEIEIVLYKPEPPR